MITLEMQWIVKLLDAYINERAIELPVSFPYAKLYKAAKAHSVVPIIFQELHKLNVDGVKPSGEIQEIFRKSYISAVYLSSLQDFGVEEFGEKLAEQGIEYIPVKGYVIKKLYPEPELRTMSDIDFLIREEDRIKVDEILKNLGYHREGLGSNVWTYKRGMVTFEVHINLAGKKVLE